jgi:hypothetical protein
MRGLRRFKVRGKLTPRFIGPLRLWNKKMKWPINWNCPPQLSAVHDVFHLSQLKKCLGVPEEQVPLEDLVMNEDLTYQEYPVELLEASERVTPNRKIRMCKV